MRRAIGFVAAALAMAAAAGCDDAPAEGVQGRWERVGQPREWVRFDADRTFSGRGYQDSALVRGRWLQSGDTVVATSTFGHAARLVLRDSLLVMQDGTRYRRAR